jgi:ABC-type sugar transport system ATPase subunit
VSIIRDTPLPQAGKAVGIETIGMTMRFGGFTALDNVSVKVPAGTFHALLGENGAGKSTLVKCIMGFYHQTSGAVRRWPRGRVASRRRMPRPTGSAWSTSTSPWCRR